MQQSYINSNHVIGKEYVFKTIYQQILDLKIDASVF